MKWIAPKDFPEDPVAILLKVTRVRKGITEGTFVGLSRSQVNHADSLRGIRANAVVWLDNEFDAEIHQLLMPMIAATGKINSDDNL